MTYKPVPVPLLREVQRLLPSGSNILVEREALGDTVWLTSFIVSVKSLSELSEFFLSFFVKMYVDMVGVINMSTAWQKNSIPSGRIESFHLNDGGSE